MARGLFLSQLLGVEFREAVCVSFAPQFWEEGRIGFAGRGLIRPGVVPANHSNRFGVITDFWNWDMYSAIETLLYVGVASASLHFRMRWVQVGLLVQLALVQYFSQASVDCSETECGPRVSKCMLLKACNCSITRDNILHNNCSCCTECIQCLDKQYTQCCACVGKSSSENSLPPSVNSGDDRPPISFPQVFLNSSLHAERVAFPLFPLPFEKKFNICCKLFSC